MIEFRPTTWVILGVLTLLIFVPAMLMEPPELTNQPSCGYDGPVPCGPQVPIAPGDDTGEEDRRDTDEGNGDDEGDGDEGADGESASDEPSSAVE